MDAVAGPPAVRLPGEFEAFYRDEYVAVVAVVHVLSGTRWAAEDLTQEAFLRAYRDWDRVGRMSSPQGWVRRVAINLARSRFRRLRSEASARLRLSAHTPSLDPLPPEDEAFWDEVRKLPRRQAQAISLRYVAELSVTEIAGTLEVAEGTVRALLHQGRTRLERQLVAKGWVEK